MSHALKLSLLLISVVAGGARNASTRAADVFPPSSKILKGVLVSAFTIKDSRTRSQFRESVQPLWFVLYRTRDRASARVLADLTWYKLGESDDEIFRCVFTKRALAERAVADALSDSPNDCVTRLGEQSDACRSTSEHSQYVAELREAIRVRRHCDLEY